MSKNLKPSWAFTVSDAADIDIQRILNETPKESPWCIIADRGGAVGLIALRTEFLSRFRAEDDIKVGFEYLGPDWGYEYSYDAKQSGRDRFHVKCGDSNSLGYPGWRCLRVSRPAIESVLEQLEAAECHRRRIPVRVYVKES